jgi:benzoate/toluate 1,2-dioxygenase subunit beta
MINDQNWLAVQRFLSREAQTLDEKKWDEWLDLYDSEAEYWVPAWDDGGETTTDPQTEISLIYYPTRAGLEDRVFRIRTGRSSATMPLMRTCHMFNLLDVVKSDGGYSARTSWQVNSFREDTTITYYGWAEYDLMKDGDTLRITRKKTTVLNDISRTVLDVYNI